MKLVKHLLLFLSFVGYACAQMPTPIAQENLRGWGAFVATVATNDVVVCAVQTESSSTGLSDANGKVPSFTSVDNFTGGGINTRTWIGTATSAGATSIAPSGTASFAGHGCAVIRNVSGTADAHTAVSYSGSPSTISTTLTTVKGQDYLWCYAAGFRNAGLFWNDPAWTFEGMSNGSDSGGAVHVITGAPGSTTAKIRNSGNDQGNFACIALKPSSFNIADTALPTGSLSNAYTYALNIAGGVGAYTCTITSGSLPTGMTFTSCKLAGTPSSGGSFPLTFQASDGSATPTKSLTLTINSSGGTPAVVQVCNSGGSANCTLLSSNVVIGNILVAVISSTTSATTVNLTCKDSLGNALTWAGTTSDASVGGYTHMIFVGPVTIAGSSTSACSVPSGGFSIGFAEISGAQAFTDLYVQDTTMNALSSTTVVPNSMVIGFGSNQQASTTIAAVAPFTQLISNSGAHDANLAEYKVEAAAGTYSPTFTTSASNFTQSNITLRPITSGVIINAVTRHRAQLN